MMVARDGWRSRNHQHKGGYILVAVLGVMLTVTSLVASASLFARSTLQSAKAGDHDMELGGLVNGGIEIAAYQLFVLKLPLANVDRRLIRLGGGTITPEISDEAGKIDVNSANIAVLQSAFESVGMNRGRVAELVTRIEQWRGPQPGREPAPAPSIARGAPESAPATGRHTGFRSVEDFGDDLGLSKTEAALLEPLLTTYNPSGMVNVLTASRRVLMALPGMSAAAAAGLVKRRSGLDPNNHADMDGLKSDLAAQTLYIKTDPGPVYQMRIEAISAEGGTKRAQAFVAASPGEAEPYLVFRWGG